MRQIIVDTETTGLDAEKGHRIIEIGCVEVINRRHTGRHFHHYLNPERDIDDGAYSVHGISNDDLKDKPLFKALAQEFIDFVRDAELIIHNAPFDVGFINAELGLLGKQWGSLDDYCRIIDTLVMARELHPGQKNSLDALCSRYEVDNSQRDLHGALLDAQILLDVYLAMTGGQAALLLDEESNTSIGSHYEYHRGDNSTALCTIQPTAEESSAHAAMLKNMAEQSQAEPLWWQAENH